MPAGPIRVRCRATAAILGALLALTVVGPATAAEPAEAPFGNNITDGIRNYLRASPVIGTAGALTAAGVEEARALGFKTIVDLTTAEEALADEGRLVVAAGLRYINIPVAGKAPTDGQVARFAVVVEDPSNHPVLVHCESANRVGALWALYRARGGVPAEVAVEEGRTIGLKPSREAAVRERLGLPPLAP